MRPARAIGPRSAGPDTRRVSAIHLRFDRRSQGRGRDAWQFAAQSVGHLRRLRQSAPTAVTVSWLPIYHDMGLIGGILGPLYAGGSLTLLVAQAISGASARLAGSDQQIRGHACRRAELRLRLVPAANDARDARAARSEPLAGGLLRSRADPPGNADPVLPRPLPRPAFSPTRFRPCYGLAEATLMVTARKAPIALLDRADLQARRSSKAGLRPTATAPDDVALAVVGSGSVVGGQRVVIVDPETCRPNPSGRVGEIWVQGPSVASGYWNRAQLSAEVFEARLADTGEGPFLRTGDLGCFHQGQLFVTGRIKELIIVRGRNHYPQDIELTAQSSHADLQAGGGVAFR